MGLFDFIDALFGSELSGDDFSSGGGGNLFTDDYVVRDSHGKIVGGGNNSKEVRQAFNAAKKAGVERPWVDKNPTKGGKR